MKDAHRRAIGYARENNALISFDPNLRFMLWDSEEALKEAVLEFIPEADILKLSDEELEFITGTDEIEKALPELFEKGVKLVLYTCGKDGMFAFTRKASAHAISPKVEVVDTTGAGDAFFAGASVGLLRRLPLAKACRLGSEAAARVLSTKENVLR